jgi:hypothetical protein
VHNEQHEAHALKNELEEAITDAFLDRLEAAGDDRTARPTVLRAAVQARAGVAAIRGLMIAYPAGGGTGCGQESGIGPLPVGELTQLVTTRQRSGSRSARWRTRSSDGRETSSTRRGHEESFAARAAAVPLRGLSIRTTR